MLNYIKDFIKKYWILLIAFTVIGLVGGVFTGLYSWDSLGEEFLKEAADAGLNKPLYAVVSALQAAGYAIFCGVFGIVLSKKIGLWKDEFKFEKKPIIYAILVAALGGIVTMLLDMFVFGAIENVIAESYKDKPTIEFIIASLTYGGVIEELMIRLFLMSLIAFVIHKIFAKNKEEKVSNKVLIIANIIAALVFSAAHLPSTAMFMGLNAVIVIRCFLINGLLGFMFGELYRKYGITYAIIGHIVIHIVMKLIWILFV